MNELNEVVISLLEKTENYLSISCKVNQKCFIKDEDTFPMNRNDFFIYGFILEGKDVKNIEFEIENEKITKLAFDTSKIIKLPDGDNLGKLIVDNYLEGDKCIDKNLRINLSKDFKILTDETAFYAKIINENPTKDKMVLITNKNKVAENIMFGYDNDNDNEELQTGEKKKNWFSDFFSNLFTKDNIIKKKNYKFKEKKKFSFPKIKLNFRFRKDISYAAAPERFDDYVDGIEDDDKDGIDMDGYNMDFEDIGYKCSYKISSPKSPSSPRSPKSPSSPKKDKIEIKEEKKISFDFDEFILDQDIIEGNWTNSPQYQELINLEKDLYNKIKHLAENKGLKNENGIITLFVLFFIYNKKKDKINELKFVINKAKNYVKKIFNANYDDIVKEIEN